MEEISIKNSLTPTPTKVKAHEKFLYIAYFCQFFRRYRCPISHYHTSVTRVRAHVTHTRACACVHKLYTRARSRIPHCVYIRDQRQTDNRQLTTNRTHDDNNPMYLKFIHHTVWENINASLIVSNLLLLSLN